MFRVQLYILMIAPLKSNEVKLKGAHMTGERKKRLSKPVRSKTVCVSFLMPRVPWGWL